MVDTHVCIYCCLHKLTSLPNVRAPQTEGLPTGRGPVLIRALASREGAVHEVVMRLDVTEYGTSQVRHSCNRGIRVELAHALLS